MLSSNEKIKFRILLCVIFLFMPFAIYVICGLYNVQINKHEEYLVRAKRTYTDFKKKHGKRGEIFSNDNFILISNQPYVRLIADASHMLPEKNCYEQKTARMCADILKLDYNTVLKKLCRLVPKRDKSGKYILDSNGKVQLRRSRYIQLSRELSLETAALIRQEITKQKLKGLYFEHAHKRFYPKGSMLAPILGITVYDKGREKPTFGVERAMDKHLRPQSVQNLVEISRDGRKLSYGLSEEFDVQDGKNIYLTIREPIQAILEDELDKAFEKLNSQAIYAIMLDPKTGNIMAMGQRPTFDPNNRKTITNEAVRPRIIADVMEPGSIIKPFSVAFALDNNMVRPETIIDCENGYWIFRGKPLTDSHRIGKVSVTEVIKQSSNIGTAKIGIMMGEKNVYNNLRKFGFGQRTGIPLTPESVGDLKPVSRWDGLTVSRIPMGYALNVTPVQMVRAYGALADNGNLRKIRLIDRIEDPETKEVKVMPYEPPIQMFKNPQAHREIVDMMVQVTGKGGTAQQAAVKGYEVAGKTGTSRKYVPGVGYSRGKYFASFVGFVPAHDPAFVLLVTVDSPKGRSYYGGTVSGPVFRAIAERTLKYLNIAPTVIEEGKKDR
ncbi:MAG: penicillin-binding protein 2 [Lentisphaeria bacterium]|nr:penicillin-binding protein 2 [Lentisphaeria bacterium]